RDPLEFGREQMVKPESHQVGEGADDEQNRVASGLELVQQLACEDWEKYTRCGTGSTAQADKGCDRALRKHVRRRRVKARRPCLMCRSRQANQENCTPGADCCDKQNRYNT